MSACGACLTRSTGGLSPPSAPSLLQYSHPPVIAGGARRTEPRKYLLETDPRFRRVAEMRQRRAHELGSSLAQAAYAQLEGAHRYQTKVAAMLQSQQGDTSRHEYGRRSHASLTVRRSIPGGEPDSFKLRARGMIT